MFMITLYLIWWVCLMEYGCLDAADSDIQEYCTFESFEPDCPEGQVVVVQQAVYGRMRVGKCLTTDFYIGCAVNVLQIADSSCSGRQNCRINVPNPQMAEAVNCLEDPSLLTYFEASSGCVEVFRPQRQTCTSPENVDAETKPNYLSSVVSRDTSCGFHKSPWIIMSKPGQQIEISLLDFSWDNKSNIDAIGSPGNCRKNYGYIVDIESDDVIIICGGTLREKHIYTSRSNSVQIVLDPPLLQNHFYLISYKAIGCPTFKAPPHTRQEKENGSLVIGCVSSNKTWKLLCVNNIWLGLVGNCTPPSTTVTIITMASTSPKKGEHKSASSLTLPVVETNHVITFILACVTLIVCCSVIVLGIYCTKRYEVKKLKRHRQGVNALPFMHDGNRTLIYRTSQRQSLQKQDNPPTYSAALPKDERPPPPPERRHSTQPKRERNSDYLKPCGGDVGGDESVHYYILENLIDGTEGEKVYQNL